MDVITKVVVVDQMTVSNAFLAASKHRKKLFVRCDKQKLITSNSKKILIVFQTCITSNILYSFVDTVCIIKLQITELYHLSTVFS